jgi:ABC-type bacteriocin/lantibiotic exporter with double-glycine peptidase domain
MDSMEKLFQKGEKIRNFNLDVPFIKQRFQNDCVQTCVLMLLKYFEFNEFDYNKLCEIMNPTAAGTSFESFVFLNKQLVKSKCPIVFQVEKSKILNHEQLLELIQGGKPAIAYIDKEFLDKLKTRTFPSGRHAIVVYGKRGDKIIYNDPLNDGASDVHLNRFVNAWAERVFIYAEKNPQTRL